MRRLFAFSPSYFVFLFLLGSSFWSFAQSTAVPMNSHPIEPTSWTFECVYESGCGPGGTWITTTSQPGTTRLWYSGTGWSQLEPESGTYLWTNLDTWLDLVAEHQPRAILFTFGQTPCWIASVACTGNGWGPGNAWSATPPSDLTASGSPSFTSFVTALTEHCSPAGNCVKDYVKYWEMWNEPNLLPYWTGTANQLYEMFKPVIPIIRKNVPGAITSTPPVGGGDSTWMASWMVLENTNGRISDYYGFHSYMQAFTPEKRMGMVENMVNTKNDNGWTTTPWMNTETNFVSTNLTCSTDYTAQECQGQLVRWFILQFAYQGGAGGAFSVGWYDWNSITAGGYDTYYDTMMRWLAGSTFTASCSNAKDTTVWTCPLTEADGATALIVWNTAGDSSYTPANEYVRYREFNGTYGGAIVHISPGESTTIGVVPIMFETTT
jgi:polysaccharide biosynthesis protein PslG